MNSGFETTVTVERVLSQLDAGCIFSGRTSDGSGLRVKFSGRGILPLPGDVFHVQGQLSPFRDRYGALVPQVSCSRMRRVVAQGDLLIPWLERLPNIGSTRSARLVNAFGHGIADVLANAHRLPEVAAALEPSKPSLAVKIAAQLYSAMAEKAGADLVRTAEVEFLIFLERLGIGEPRVANHLWRLMAGPDAIGRLQRNPYVPACLLDWKVADRLGQRLLRAGGEDAIDLHPLRLSGALSSVWRELLQEGDTAASETDVIQLLQARSVDALATIRYAEEVGLLVRTAALIRVPGAAWLENQVSEALRVMENREPSISVPSGEALHSLVYEAEKAAGMQLTEEQHAAVADLLTRPVGALQGGAGVGKTTVMKVLAIAWEALDGNVVMGALAGKAALTLSRGASSSSRPRLAYTVARLIGMLERHREQALSTERRPVDGDVRFTQRTLLIVDEAGMLDTPSLHKLLNLLPGGARLLLVGDEGQLPPVGIGKVFHDLVADGLRVVRLTRVLRQAADSEIPRVATMIRAGQTPSLPRWAGEPKGVYAIGHAEREAAQRILRERGELMVIAARKATVSGINEAESAEVRSTTTATRRLGPLATVAVGDPVVMTTNRYQQALFNGLLGTVVSIGDACVSIAWDGDDSPRALANESEGDIELAYAITCHKSQGSSSLAVIVVVETSRLVTREWLYTAVTRGRELVLLVGDHEALEHGIGRRTLRTTGFALAPKTFATGLAS